MRVAMVDPSAFTLPYDHALSSALVRAGAEVELLTSRFAYGEGPEPTGYALREHFYRHAVGAPGSGLRRAAKLAEHVPDMLRLRARAADHFDIVHFQWLDVQWLDGYLLPRRPVVLTAHDLLPREARTGQAAAQRRLYDRAAAVIVHSEYGRHQLVGQLGVPAGKVRVIPHGAFAHLTELSPASLPRELEDGERPVVLFFGLLRPYKGIETLLAAWHGIADAELWVVGRPRMDIAPLRTQAGAGVRFVPRFVGDAELAALFRRADIVVLPYARTERFDFSGVLATALAFGKAVLLSDVGGFSEVADAGAARLVAPGDAVALHDGLVELLSDASRRESLAAAALAAANGRYSWDTAAQATLALYRELV
ncbi:MAG TPA: glycosyltransferase family 4 protein [Solirubrobacteraceae bacterium]|jgi:glycosyltransferase involved in cell wall biosynthesis